MSQKLANQVAVVTGASKGIGAEIAKTLAAAGASVVVNYASSKQGAERVVHEITSSGGKAIAVRADVSKEEDVQRLFAETREAFGPIDVLVNNAGIYEFAALEEITPEHFHTQFNLNVLGLLLVSKEALKYFKPSGGSIVNVSSVVSQVTPPNTAVYSATKASVDAITQALAKELGPKNIRVNSVNPGLIVTEGADSAGILNGDFEKNMVAQTPLGRVGQPDDIAPVVLFLASADSKWVTGESLITSGGLR